MLILKPRRAATSSKRNAVVRFSDSYGGSMSANVRVLVDILISSMPERFVAFGHVVDDDVDRCGLDAGGESRVRDAPLAEREIVGEHSHARLDEGREPGDLRPAPGGKGTALPQ